MKLSEHIEDLKKILAEHGDLNCVYAADDEGNAYYDLHASPCVGKHDGEYGGQFYAEESKDYYEEYNDDKFVVDSVCVN